MENKSLAVRSDFLIPAPMYDGAAEVSYDIEEFEDIAPGFPRVKIPAGGQLAFEIPNPDNPDDPEPCKTLEGIIVLQHTAYSYWSSSDTTGTPPDCSSLDGVTGYGVPGGKCAACPLNEFGSGEGGAGKACKNMKSLYILRNGDLMPIELNLPPTSLKAFRQYANNLRFAGRALSSVITSIGLKRQEGDGNTYSVATFRMAAPLSDDLIKSGRAYAQGMRQNLLAMRAERQAPAAECGAAAPPPVDIDPETGEIVGGEF